MSKRRRYLSDAIVIAICLMGCSAPAVIHLPPTTALPKPGPPLSPAESPARKTTLAAIPFTIQVGAFSTSERAARYAASLESVGLDAYYFIDVDGLYKVRFERYDTKIAARQRAESLVVQDLIDEFYIVSPTPGIEPINPDAFLRKSIVETAMRFIGTPYRWGGESASTGFDCSGLTMTVYRLNGLDLPRNSRAQYDSGTSVPLNAIKKGDLVFFATGFGNRVSHVGIYDGDGKFIHAPKKGRHICLSTMSSGYYRKRFMGARRYF